MSIIDKLKSLFGPSGSNGLVALNGDMSEGGGEMISCEEALRLVHGFLDGELDSVPAGRVKAHFDVCQRCYPHLHLETAFRDAVRRAAGGGTAPSELKSKVAALIAEAEAED
jgi:anti-sigma factor (TIGR02949 family)